MVILDACRTNPYLARMVLNGATTRAVAQGLAAIDPTHGEVVFYAARDGSVAADGPGANSPFATALVKHMEEEGVELGRFFRKVTSLCARPRPRISKNPSSTAASRTRTFISNRRCDRHRRTASNAGDKETRYSAAAVRHMGNLDAPPFR